MARESKSLKDKEKGKDPHPRERSVRLKDINDVNRFLARIINMVLRGEISESRGGKLGYLCSVMLRSFEGLELEKRLEELEAIVREQGKNAQ